MTTIINTKGVDVSELNGDISFKTIKNAGFEWVMIRCGYGDDMTSQDDEYFATYNIGFFTHVGVEFLKKFRAGLVWRYALMDSDPVPTIAVYGLGGFFAYMF